MRNGHCRPGEAEVRPSRHVHVGHHPLVVPDDDPWGRDDEDKPDEQHDAAPDEIPDAEIDRQRPPPAAAYPPGVCRRAARLRHRRRARRHRHQARDFAGLLPAGHSLGPDQRVWPEPSADDQVAQLLLGEWALLLAIGGIKPGSARHVVPSAVSASHGRAAGGGNRTARRGEPHSGGGSCRLYRDRERPDRNVFPRTCNFFVPFAQKDARFGLASTARQANCPALH